ncbi:hypothetical protein B0X71_19645 (plasmid) [Planococcus lenghuensis]|uniref:Uncharacterized protein n=1 Tax=Planococcus lenghuensis TaxID=2213202 RepID=A0A1Q2L4N6_9BACL|nr:hypothetical protein B0X71_19645 [Planococcus lenghuensis]
MQIILYALLLIILAVTWAGSVIAYAKEYNTKIKWAERLLVSAIVTLLFLVGSSMTYYFTTL